MRFAALASMLLLAACATAPPERNAPEAWIPSVWPAPPWTTLPRCPSCGQPLPLVFPQPITPPPVLDADEALRRASVGGRYSELLAKVEVPNDWLSYGPFCDWGFWAGTSYAGADDLPPGHWVYVHPNWYVWREAGPAASVR
jgi:hypothetical protein